MLQSSRRSLQRHSSSPRLKNIQLARFQDRATVEFRSLTAVVLGPEQGLWLPSPLLARHIARAALRFLDPERPIDHLYACRSKAGPDIAISRSKTPANDGHVRGVPTKILD